MQFEEVRRLVRLVEESDIDELDLWRWWGRVRIRKSPAGQAAAVPSFAVAAPPAAPAAAAPAPETNDAGDDSGLTPIQSPMVGTLYRSPAPDADPYIQVGDTVEPGQTVCIVEAMKLMNEIQSEVRGKVVKILVENSQPVEFGQPLFLIQEQ
jgi:oxaloacetate decarboxylase alpha subunit